MARLTIHGASFAVVAGLTLVGFGALQRQRVVVAEPRSQRTSAPWMQTIGARLETAEYEVHQTASRLQATNRAHDLRAHFDGAATTLMSRQDASPSVTMQATAWGHGSEETPLAQATPVLGSCLDNGAQSAKGQCQRRVERAYGGLTEWWENTQKGLEHGFTLTRPPAERRAHQSDVFVELALSGARAEVEDGARSAMLVRADGHRWRYGGLTAMDATGRELGARMSRTERGMRLTVDDSEAVYPITIDPLLTAAAWNVESNQTSALYGWSVASAGDVNGDGFDDVIVGAFNYSNGETSEGAAFVYLGSASGLATSAAWTGESNQASAVFGWSVGSAGDVNGDGFGDVIVGAPGYDNGQTNEGAAFVYLGSAAGLAASPAWTGELNQAGAALGISVASAGDVNGDGFGDVIVGAWYYANGETDEGAALVYLGSASGLAISAASTLEANQASAAFGLSVASAGDVNGDGYGDVVVGAHFYDNGQTDEGAASVYLGSASGLATSAAWTAESNQAGADFGVSVGSAGDVNGDGYGDVIVGAWRYDNGQTSEGAAFVYLGSAAGLATSAAWTAEANLAMAEFGYSVASAGDVNGDGYADVIVGAPHYDNGQAGEGAASVYLGSASGLATSAAWTVEANQGFTNLGNSVASAGDVNGDGCADVIVGAPYYDHGQTDEGGAFVYLAAGPDHLAVTVQPTNSVAGVGIAPAIQVAVQDSLGNLITTSKASITMAIGTNPGGGVLSGTTTVKPVGGIGTFSNLSIDVAGNGYTLVATSSGLADATSDPFNVAASSPAGCGCHAGRGSSAWALAACLAGLLRRRRRLRGVLTASEVVHAG